MIVLRHRQGRFFVLSIIALLLLTDQATSITPPIAEEKAPDGKDPEIRTDTLQQTAPETPSVVSAQGDADTKSQIDKDKESESNKHTKDEDKGVKNSHESQRDMVNYIVPCVGMLCVILSFWLTHVLHKPWISESAIIVLMGVVLGGIVMVIDLYIDKHRSYKDSITFGLHNFIDMLLPIIIFEAGYSLPHTGVIRNLGCILVFAIIGTMISTLIITLAIFYLSKALLPKLFNSPGSFFLFASWGSLMSATDPVAVIAVLGSKYNLKDMVEPPLLYNLIFGEAVLNDAVAIVLFNTCLQYISIDFSYSSLGGAFGNFCYAFLVAILIGYVTGCLCSIFMKYVDIRSHNEIELLTLMVFAAFSYYVAEAIHTSGIMSLFVCARMLGSRATLNCSTKTKSAAGPFFKTLAIAAESYIFLFLGLAVWAYEHYVHWGFLGLSLVVVLLSRAFVVYPLSFVCNLSRKVGVITLRMQTFMWFSGLRGAIAFGLSLVLLEKGLAGAPNIESDYFNMMLSTTLFHVLFMVIILGSLSGVVLSLLGLDVLESKVRGMGELEERMHHVKTDEERDVIRLDMEGLLRMNDDEHSTESYLKYFRVKLFDFERRFIAPFLVRKEALWNEYRSDTTHCPVDLRKYFTDQDAHDAHHSVVEHGNHLDSPRSDYTAPSRSFGDGYSHELDENNDLDAVELIDAKTNLEFTFSAS